MRPRDLFGVGIRVLGIWFFCDAVYWGYWTIVKVSGGPGNPRVSIAEDTARTILSLAEGLLLVVLADFIVGWVYGPQVRASVSDKTEKPDV